MKVAALRSDNGCIEVEVRVYTRRDSFLRAIRAHGYKPSKTTRGMAVTYEAIDYRTSKRGVKRTRSHVFLMHDWCTPGVLAHEFNHVAHDLAHIYPRKRMSGAGGRRGNFEETVCCYLDELMDIFDPWMKKNKLYRSRKNKFHGLITP